MARAMVQCRVCKEKFNRLDPNLKEGEDFVQPVKKFYYHKKCYEDFASKKGKISSGDITLEAEEEVWRSAVYDYLRRDLKIDLNYLKFISQWNNFLKKDMTAKGMYFALKYFYEVARGDVNKSENGIGIIPHIYLEAKEYWQKRNEKEVGIVAAIEKQIFEAANQNTVVIKLEKPNKKKQTAAERLAIIADMEEDE